MILTPEQLAARSTARSFAQEQLAPHSAEWDRTATFPRDALREMGKLGFLGMPVPPEWDGAGMDYIAYALALEEIAAGDGAVSTIMSGHNSVGCMPLVEYGSNDQKQSLLKPMARGELLSAFCLTEPQGGSDAAAIRTRAERHDNYYLLNGTKQFVTSGKNAQIALVFAVTDPAKGKHGISCFLVETDRPGYHIGRVEKKMGQNASDTCEIRLDRLRVPTESARRRGAGLSHRARQSRGRAHRHRRAGAGHVARGLRDRARLRAAARDVRKTHHRASGGGLPPRRHGDRAGGRAAVDPARRRAPQPGAALPQRGLDGEIVCQRDRRARLLGCDPDAGRRRLHNGSRRRAHFPRRAGHQDLRGHQRHPAPGDQPRACRRG